MRAHRSLAGDGLLHCLILPTGAASDTASIQSFNPLDPPFLGGFGAIGGRPQTLGRMNPAPLPSVLAELVLVNTGSGNPVVADTASMLDLNSLAPSLPQPVTAMTDYWAYVPLHLLMLERTHSAHSSMPSWVVQDTWNHSGFRVHALDRLEESGDVEAWRRAAGRSC